ncbi:hypothetical protein EWM64_g4070 [Hericium alpestre]|uniref:DUF6534 domain-containing protein n=1 Tax=Hericium alpestre TaxID=135208 RepID=A0A4Z0A0I0_9AGAM|nr:hypothetical protein EWM64_g4070 [Hericium alpestre]
MVFIYQSLINHFGDVDYIQNADWVFAAVGGIATAIAIGYVPQFLRFTVFQPAVIVWLMSSAVCDVLITSILVFHLRRHKSGFSHTDDIVDRVIRLTIQTGLLTSIVAIIDVVLYLGVPKAALHLGFNMPLCKLYTNSLLSSLNARSGWALNSNSDPVHSIGQSGAKRVGRPPTSFLELADPDPI